MNNVAVIEHPLVEHFLAILRDRKTRNSDFKHALERISYLIATIVYSELRADKVSVVTPLKKTQGKKVRQTVVLLPILRAGLGLVQGFTDLYPEIKMSHIGLFRDEKSLKPVKYYFNFPKLKDRKNAKVIVLDPMIATGGSAVFTIEYLLKMGIRDITLVSLLLAPEGYEALDKKFTAKEKKCIRIYTCSVDEGLNEKGFILPGLGDAGDRMFGTE